MLMSSVCCCCGAAACDGAAAFGLSIGPRPVINHSGDKSSKVAITFDIMSSVMPVFASKVPRDMLVNS